MSKPNRREDYLRRERTKNIIILASIVVLIFVCSTDAFKGFTSHLFGTDKEDNKSPASSEISEGENTEEELPLKIFCFDVGEGTSTLIRVPINKGYRDILIDAGDKENSDKLLSRLGKINSTYIETVVCAHKDENNIGGMASVIEKYTVKDFFVVAKADSDEVDLSDELASAVSSRQLRAQTLADGDGLSYQDSYNSLEIEFYSAEGEESGLNYSIRYKELKLNFTGNAEACVNVDNGDEYMSTKQSGMITITADKDGNIKTETGR